MADGDVEEDYSLLPFAERFAHKVSLSVTDELDNRTLHVRSPSLDSWTR